LNDLRKEIAKNGQKVKFYSNMRSILVQIHDCTQLALKEQDPEIKQMAEAEKKDLLELLQEETDEIIEVIIPKVDADSKNCQIEI